MWFLKSQSTNRCFYIHGKKNEYIVGRSADTSDLGLPEDSSVSRRHAIFIKDGECLIFQDLGSKYGSIINGNPASKNEKISLKEDDKIQFGILKNKWSVHNKQFITCTSTVKGENLEALKTNLRQLRGTLKSEWDDYCYYLTMPAITLTIKVVLALVQGSYIVTLEYWDKCTQAIRQLTNLPEPKDYLPQVIEATLNSENVSFLPNAERKTLFAGKMVLFFSRRQMEMFRSVLSKSSAAVALLSESKMTKAKLCGDSIIVMQYTPLSKSQESQAQQNQINDIVTYLKKQGRRVIPDVEIGLAILYCSTIKYCNPCFNFSLQVMNQNESCSTSKQGIATILAPETQETTISKELMQEKTIEQSLTSINNEDLPNETAVPSSDIKHPIVLKRKLIDSDDSEFSMSKRQAFDTTANNNTDDGLFDFIETKKAKPAMSENNAQKKLSFMKPRKRKISSTECEEDLFNFLPTDTKTVNKDIAHSINTRIFAEPTVNTPQEHILKKTKLESECEETATSLRGKKQKLLLILEKSLWKCCDQEQAEYAVKQESKEDTDIKNKMENMDLGATVVIVRRDLVVKRDPSDLAVSVNSSSNVINFKKFKKVLPLRMQVTIVPKSAMSIVRGDASAIVHDGPFSSSGEEEEIVVKQFSRNKRSIKPR